MVRLRDTFFNPEVIYQKDMIDELLRGLATAPMETLDPFITKEVTNHLFEDRRMPYSGMDLAAINIQRGIYSLSFYFYFIQSFYFGKQYCHNCMV